MRDCLGWKAKMVSQFGEWSRFYLKESTEYFDREREPLRAGGVHSCVTF